MRQRHCSCTRVRWFESVSLQQRVRRNRWLGNGCGAGTMLHGAPTVHQGIKHFHGPAAGVGWQRACGRCIRAPFLTLGSHRAIQSQPRPPSSHPEAAAQSEQLGCLLALQSWPERADEGCIPFALRHSQNLLQVSQNLCCCELISLVGGAGKQGLDARSGGFECLRGDIRLGVNRSLGDCG